MKDKLGFTLIELLLTIAIITILAGLSIPVYLNFQTRTDLTVATHSVAHTYRRAQAMSQGVVGDSNWGLSVTSGEITLFKGLSYATRDTGYDEIIFIPNNINITGTSEVVFDKLTGEPQQNGSLTLTSVDGETELLQFNNKGMVNY